MQATASLTCEVTACVLALIEKMKETTDFGRNATELRSTASVDVETETCDVWIRSSSAADLVDFLPPSRRSRNQENFTSPFLSLQTFVLRLFLRGSGPIFHGVTVCVAWRSRVARPGRFAFQSYRSLTPHATIQARQPRSPQRLRRQRMLGCPNMIW